jgi:hypothetical protein
MSALRKRIDVWADQKNDNCTIVSQGMISLLTDMAVQIRSGLNLRGEEYIHSVVSYIYSQEDWSSAYMKSTDTVVSSWRHLSVYALHFGETLGKIERFDIPPAIWDGQCFITPEHLKKGTARKAPWEVQVTLNTECLKSIEGNSLLDWALRGEVLS